MKELTAAPAAACLALTALFAIPALGATTRTVSVKDSFFSPKSLTVTKGTKVKWVWRGALAHNVVLQKGPATFSSGRPKVKGTYTRTLTRRGSYRIICEIHPGMRLTIKVR